MASEQSLDTEHIQPGVLAIMSPDDKYILLAGPDSDEDRERIRQGLHIQKAPPNLTLAELETDIVGYIGDWHTGRYGKVGRPTFTCLEQRYGRPRMGGTDLEVTGSKNIVLWQGLLPNLAQAIVDLCVNGKIHWHQTPAIHYLVEGRALPLPLTRWPITEEYDKTHWLAVEFCLGPSCDSVFCPNKAR